MPTLHNTLVALLDYLSDYLIFVVLCNHMRGVIKENRLRTISVCAVTKSSVTVG